MPPSASTPLRHFLPLPSPARGTIIAIPFPRGFRLRPAGSYRHTLTALTNTPRRCQKLQNANFLVHGAESSRRTRHYH